MPFGVLFYPQFDDRHILTLLGPNWSKFFLLRLISVEESEHEHNCHQRRSALVSAVAGESVQTPVLMASPLEKFPGIDDDPPKAASEAKAFPTAAPTL